jgi:CRISPR-associated protein Cst1
MKDSIFFITGNPFVDSGIYAISYWLDKDIEEIQKEDLESTVDELTNLYLTQQWQKSMHSIFPNSLLINTAVKDKRKEYSNFLISLIKGIEPINSVGGCIGCGRRNTLEMTKTQVPLTGTRKLINFFSYGKGGADYCPACVLAIQFSPLLYCNGGKRFFLVHSPSRRFMEQLANDCIQHIRKNWAAGILDEGYRNPVNSIFFIAEKIIRELDEVEEKTPVRLYYFTNYNQGPELDIYDFPIKVFSFLVKIKNNHLWERWHEITQRGFIIKKEEVLEESEHKNKFNFVYNNLMNNKNILKSFIDVKNKKALGGWKLLALYLQEVRGMEDKRIQIIKELSHKIALHIETQNDKNAFKKFVNAKTYSSFRAALFHVIHKMSKYAEMPLLTLDEYVNYIVPDTKIWKETKDLIIFGLYEKLHDWIRNEELPEIEVEDLEEDEE